jgi:hypothetical protein
MHDDKSSLRTLPFGDPASLDLQMTYAPPSHEVKALRHLTPLLQLCFRQGLQSASHVLVDANKYDHMLKDPTVHAMPYDFRRMDEEPYLHTLFRDIKSYIESFQQPIAVVTHSTGGLLFHWFVHNQTPEWRAQWIQTVINVNVPFAGTMTVLENCVFRDTSLIRIVGSDVFRSLGATVINMPNPRYIPHILNVNGEWVEDYLEYLGLDDIKRRWNQPHIQAMIDSFSHPTFIDTHIVTSSSSDRTVSGIRVDISNKLHTRIYGDGDGVVSIESLMVPQSWTPSANIAFHHLPDMGHSGMFQNHRFMTNCL